MAALPSAELVVVPAGPPLWVEAWRGGSLPASRFEDACNGCMVSRDRGGNWARRQMQQTVAQREGCISMQNWAKIDVPPRPARGADGRVRRCPAETPGLSVLT